MRGSVKAKALLVMIPIVIANSALYTADSIRTEKSIARHEIIRRAETITTFATRSGELPILSGSVTEMRNVIALLRSNAEVSSVAFYDRNKILLAEEGVRIVSAMPALSPAKPLVMTEEPAVMVFYSPVFTVRAKESADFFQGTDKEEKTRENIGWVRLGFSKEFMAETVRRIVARGLLLAFFFTFGTSMIVYFLISAATRPLNWIVSIAHGIAHGDLSQDIVLERKDEIGALARAFHIMKETIQQVFQETNRLIASVRAGHFDTRGKAEAFEGGWRQLVVGLNDLTDALNEAKQRAEIANQAKTSFLSRMSHELRTPLNAILGYAQILGHQENLSQTQRQQLGIVRSSGEHLMTLINDLLDVAKIEAQKMELHEQHLDLTALLQQVFDITKVKADEKELLFGFEALTPLPEYVRGDERKLKQILLNLLSNAVKYTNRGHVTLRVSYDVHSSIFRAEVADTGIGIPTDKLGGIFEPFSQLALESRQLEGTGLGLAITKQLVNLMHGQVSVKSELGKGSTFLVEVALAAVLAPGIVGVPERRITSYRGGRKSVLVVDDNVHNASMLVSLLEPLGFEVRAAANGKEAIEKLRDRRADLAIMDLMMPVMDGAEAVQEIRRHPEFDRVRVIGVSATITDSSRRDRFKALCDRFVTKPILIQHLLDTVAALLGIEWETESPVLPPIEPARAVEELDRISVPPLFALQELRELARLGDMTRVRDWAEQLQRSEPRYGRFAARLRELVQAFKTRAILNLVEQAIAMKENERNDKSSA